MQFIPINNKVKQPLYKRRKNNIQMKFKNWFIILINNKNTYTLQDIIIYSKVGVSRAQRPTPAKHMNNYKLKKIKINSIKEIKQKNSLFKTTVIIFI